MQSSGGKNILLTSCLSPLSDADATWLRSEVAFPLGSVAQTQAARVSVTVAAHQNENGQPVFSIFVDQSLARYLWGAIEDAMGEWLG